jgi:hypothetical protein
MTDLKLIFSTIKIVFIKESTTGVQVGKTTAATEEHIHNDSGIA